jgi:hypothetical protein
MDNWTTFAVMSDDIIMLAIRFVHCCALSCSLGKNGCFLGNNIFLLFLKFTIEQATKAQRGSIGIAVLFL